MKGIIFTEFLEMVEETMGMDTVDALFERTTLASKGVYAATGTYPHEELVALVVCLSKMTGTPVPALVHAFGKRLFNSLATRSPQYLTHSRSAFEFLQSIDGYIHVEVRKIHPDAELPRFKCSLSEDGRVLQMEYRSPRRFDDLAHGLIEGVLEHYREAASITRQPLADAGEGSLFVISRV
jgi:hypothetical protein